MKLFADSQEEQTIIQKWNEAVTIKKTIKQIYKMLRHPGMFPPNFIKLLNSYINLINEIKGLFEASYEEVIDQVYVVDCATTYWDDVAKTLPKFKQTFISHFGSKTSDVCNKIDQTLINIARKNAILKLNDHLFDESRNKKSSINNSMTI